MFRPTVLLTGAGGFAGSHALRHLMMNTEYRVVCPITFRHKGLGERIASSLRDHADMAQWSDRMDVFYWDLATRASQAAIDRIGAVDAIWNIASESHVDRSIEDPVGFVQNNVQLMLNMLELARQIKPTVFMHMSTDEVFGPAEPGFSHREWEPARPSNPYSASKAAQEGLAFSYWRTYGVPIVMTNTMNLFGEMQDREKYFAKIIRAVANGEVVTVHSGPDGEMGSRFYIHARNFADAWLYLTQKALDSPIGFIQQYPMDPEFTRFNIVGDREVTNLELAQLIAQTMGKPLKHQLMDFHGSRPGHDLRYALDGSKLAALGWKAPVSFEESVRQTVKWTLEHPEWLNLCS